MRKVAVSSPYCGFFCLMVGEVEQYPLMQMIMRTYFLTIALFKTTFDFSSLNISASLLLPTSEDIQNVCLVAGAVVLAFADGAR